MSDLFTFQSASLYLSCHRGWKASSGLVEVENWVGFAIRRGSFEFLIADNLDANLGAQHDKLLDHPVAGEANEKTQIATNCANKVCEGVGHCLLLSAGEYDNTATVLWITKTLTIQCPLEARRQLSDILDDPKSLCEGSRAWNWLCFFNQKSANISPDISCCAWYQWWWNSAEGPFQQGINWNINEQWVYYVLSSYVSELCGDRWLLSHCGIN